VSKKPEGKYEPTLVYTSLIKLVAKRRRYGINKHGSSEDWRTTTPTQHHDAMMRHLLADIDGETCDENGDDHLVALVTTAMFEIERRHGGKHAIIERKRE
jgi:hypothetical protein